MTSWPRCSDAVKRFKTRGDSASHYVLAGATIAVATMLGLLLIVWMLSPLGGGSVATCGSRIPGGVAIAWRAGGMVANFMQTLQRIHTRHFFFVSLLTVPIWISEAATI